jgi:tryptophan-rich sensory protein
MEAGLEKGSIGGAVGWLVLVFATAAIGAGASMEAGEFYATLARPGWAPPASVFGPVWSVLYLMMAIAAVLAWRSRREGKARALALFAVQLALNGLWSWLFFAFHLGALAFVDIVLLWLLVVATVMAFWRLRPLAGALLLPYLAWISFAAALNFAVWRLNPVLLGA